MNAVVDAQVGRYVPPVVSSWLAKADALAPVPPGTALTLVLALVTLWLASKIVGAIFGECTVCACDLYHGAGP